MPRTRRRRKDRIRVASQTSALAKSYHAQQSTAAEAAAALIVAYWRKNPPPDRPSADRWLALSVPVVERAFRQSAAKGQAFYKATRRLEVPGSPVMKLGGLPSLDKKAVASSLWFTGPREYVDLGRAVDDIFTPERVAQIEGSVARHVQNGGREAIGEAYRRDPLAVGYYRIEGADPCSFCAMLMSRGTVYKEDSFEESDARFFGPGDAKAHDHCGGGLAPSYSRADAYPGDTKKYNDMWLDLTGKDRQGRPISPTVEFRQRFEGRY